MALRLTRGRVGSTLRRVKERKAGAPLVTEESLAKASPEAPIRKSIKEPVKRQVGRGSSKIISVPPLLDFSSPQASQFQPSTAGPRVGVNPPAPRPSIVGSTKAAPRKAAAPSKAQGVTVKASLGKATPSSGDKTAPQKSFGSRTLGGAPILRTGSGGGASAAFLRSLKFAGRALRSFGPLGLASSLFNISPIGRLINIGAGRGRRGRRS